MAWACSSAATGSATASGSFGHVFAVIDAETSEPRALKLATRATDALLARRARRARAAAPPIVAARVRGRADRRADRRRRRPARHSSSRNGSRADRCDARRWDRSARVVVADRGRRGRARGDPRGRTRPWRRRAAEHLAVGRGARCSSISGSRRRAARAARRRTWRPKRSPGRVEPRSDLYWLGATGRAARARPPPFEASDARRARPRDRDASRRRRCRCPRRSPI